MNSGSMSPSAVAIIVSICSVIIAAFSLGWNVYRDVILKPKINVDFGIKTLISEEMSNTEYVVLTATNYGPGPVTVSMIQAMNWTLWRWMTRSVKHAVVLHDYENLMSGQLPEKLEVGDKIDLLLPYDEDSMLKEEFTHVGVNDYFGRVHWVNKKAVKEARSKWIKDFSEVE